MFNVSKECLTITDLPIELQICCFILLKTNAALIYSQSASLILNLPMMSQLMDLINRISQILRLHLILKEQIIQMDGSAIAMIIAIFRQMTNICIAIHICNVTSMTTILANTLTVPLMVLATIITNILKKRHLTRLTWFNALTTRILKFLACTEPQNILTNKI